MLDSLPSEILYQIAEFLPRTSLRSVGRVSRRLHVIFSPIVYQSVTLRAVSEWALNVLDVDTFFLYHNYGRAQAYLRHTKHLCIQAPIQMVRFSRCAYYSIFRMTGMNGCSPDPLSEAVAHRHFLQDLELQISRILSCLTPHSLRSFEWRLGTCIPQGIFGVDGYLARRQPLIQHLNLQTDGTCFQAQHGLEGLSQLHDLKVLTWNGIQHRSEVQSLQRTLQCNHLHLRSFTVAFTPSAFANSLSWNLLTRSGDGPGHAPKSMPFASLRELSLSRVTLPTCLLPEDILTFRGLCSLSLYHCTNQLPFLSSLSKERSGIRLVCFEGCFDILKDDHRYMNALSEFLLSFRGLQNLHLHLSNFPPLGAAFVEAIHGHRDTLKSLVYHERQLVPLEDSGLFEDDRDVNPSWVGTFDRTIDHCRVTFLALAICPRTAQTILEPAREHTQLQLLHLRLSGPERFHQNFAREIRTLLIESERTSSAGTFALGTHLSNNKPNIYSPSRSRQIATLESEMPPSMSEAKAFISFASWVFGPQGIPSLQVLAFGHFSHEDRYEAQRFLVRRLDPLKESQVVSKHLGFVPIDLADLESWDGLSGKGAKFLAACPGNSLMESPYDF